MAGRKIALTSATAWSADSIFSKVINAQLDRRTKQKRKNKSSSHENAGRNDTYEHTVLFKASLLAWVVHREIDDVSVLRESRAQAVLAEPRAINVNGVPLSHSSALWVRV